MFRVTLQEKYSKFKRQNNGLPQGTAFFNIYTNDQPRGPTTKHFLYADDLAVATRGSNFTQTEETIEESLATLTTHYNISQLKPNTHKTQACHLRNLEAKRKLNIEQQWSKNIPCG